MNSEYLPDLTFPILLDRPIGSWTLKPGTVTLCLSQFVITFDPCSDGG
ncbi:hypothetical protein PJF56_10945 [Roseofilum sp. BLCC_M91]|uniref:Uncharacterized protein n=1 Tax=Roseofilum halophilum BLCC-M91 TaxID=3022259 RepID=A0ABT7BJM3_9CYAN|nr:hypothetical protein [Roseofilum halophilum]MDJ1179382.1 hypothetical protein [Roseofilum halophilum BLCC-M91]